MLSDFSDETNGHRGSDKLTPFIPVRRWGSGSLNWLLLLSIKDHDKPNGHTRNNQLGLLQELAVSVAEYSMGHQ